MVLFVVVLIVRRVFECFILFMNVFDLFEAFDEGRELE